MGGNRFPLSGSTCPIKKQKARLFRGEGPGLGEFGKLAL